MSGEMLTLLLGLSCVVLPTLLCLVLQMADNWKLTKDLAEARRQCRLAWERNADLTTRVAQSLRETANRESRLEQIRNLCRPDPPMMKDVLREMRDTPDEVIKELGALVPPSDTGVT